MYCSISEFLLNSIANPAHFRLNWAGLPVLFSRQLLNCSQDFFLSFQQFNFHLSFEYKTIGSVNEILKENVMNLLLHESLLVNAVVKPLHCTEFRSSLRTFGSGSVTLLLENVGQRKSLGKINLIECCSSELSIQGLRQDFDSRARI